MIERKVKMTATPCFTSRLLALTILFCGLTYPLFAATQTTAPVTTLRIVGGLATGNRYSKFERPFWVSELSKLSGGKFTAEIVPFDRAGVPGSDMLRMMQLGVIPFGTALFSQMAIEAPQFNAPDLAGLNPDMQSVRNAVAAFRPYLEKSLQERYGVEVLAVYVYPPQVLFCKKPFANLSDLTKRRIRVANATQADFIEALGAIPFRTEFADIMNSMNAGNTDCAITAAMAGNTLGLHEITSHIHSLPMTWGLSVFAVNVATWHSLNPELKALLKRELPKLERAIWEESELDAIEGIVCNTGGAGCTNGRKGRMIAVRTSESDEQRRKQIFSGTVLPRWVQRCGVSCTTVWNQTVRAVVDVAPPQPK